MAYEFSSLPPGEWILVAQGALFERKSVRVELSPGEERRLDLHLRPVETVCIQMMDATHRPILHGERIASWQVKGFINGVEATSFPYEWPEEVRFVSTPEVIDGPIQRGPYERLSFASNVILPQASCFGRMASPTQVPSFVSFQLEGGLVVDTQLLTNGSSALSFVIDPAAIEAQLSGLSFRLAPTGNGTLRQLDVDWGDGQLNFPESSGCAFEVTGLLPGMKPVTISTGGMAQRVRHVSLEPGEILDLGLLNSGHAVAVRGRVITLDGSPVAGATVDCWSTGQESEEPWQIDRYGRKTNADGRFDLVLEPGQSWLRAFGPKEIGPRWMTDSVPFWVFDEAVGEVILVAERRPRTLLIMPEDSPCFLTLKDVNGIPVSARRPWSGNPLAFYLSPAPYAFEIWSERFGGELLRSGTFVLHGGTRLLEL